MKYRILILGFLCFLSTGKIQGQASSIPDWLIIYYMPYDNNLSPLGKSIIQMIEKGIAKENILVTIQADFRDTLGMRRYVIQKDTTQSYLVDTESSSNIQTFEDYLTWIQQNFVAQHYALIFLDHGGKLDGVGLDEYPYKKFQNIHCLRPAIEAFNEKLPEKIDLLFFQVCTKGAVESIYEMKACSQYTMFSQTLLGAPNYYYEKTFQELGLNPCINGHELAQHITQNERKDMYKSYVCIDNHQLDSLRILFQAFEQTLPKSPDSLIAVNTMKNKYLFYAGEIYWDFYTFYQNLELKNAAQRQARQKLLNFVKQKLILFNHINPDNLAMKGYCGLSHLEISKNYPSHLKQYQHLRFFQDFPMKSFFNKLHIYHKLR